MCALLDLYRSLWVFLRGFTLVQVWLYFQDFRDAFGSHVRASFAHTSLTLGCCPARFWGSIGVLQSSTWNDSLKSKERPTWKTNDKREKGVQPVKCGEAQELDVELHRTYKAGQGKRYHLRKHEISSSMLTWTESKPLRQTLPSTISRTVSHCVPPARNAPCPAVFPRLAAPLFPPRGRFPTGLFASLAMATQRPSASWAVQQVAIASLQCNKDSRCCDLRRCQIH